jgi:hypothetical protein
MAGWLAGRAQVMFMSYVFGGPEAYRGRDMWSTHEDMVKNQGVLPS